MMEFELIASTHSLLQNRRREVQSAKWKTRSTESVVVSSCQLGPISYQLSTPLCPAFIFVFTKEEMDVSSV
jgi:hypothetical protein